MTQKALAISNNPQPLPFIYEVKYLNSQYRSNIQSTLLKILYFRFSEMFYIGYWTWLFTLFYAGADVDRKQSTDTHGV